MLQAIAEFASFLVLDYLIRGPGYLVCRLFLKKDEVSVEHGKVLVTGFAFWVCLIAAIYAGYSFLANAGA
jgi:hypothetical protein